MIEKLMIKQYLFDLTLLITGMVAQFSLTDKLHLVTASVIFLTAIVRLYKEIKK